jgi:hypothetical protein
VEVRSDEFTEGITEIGLTLRMSILSIRAPTASTAGSRPRRSRTAMPLGCKAKAAPTSDGRSARSTSVTRAATRLSSKLAVSPPIPAPTTTALSTIHTVDAVDDHETAVSSPAAGLNEQQPTLAAKSLAPIRPASATERFRLLLVFPPETSIDRRAENTDSDVQHVPVIGPVSEST